MREYTMELQPWSEAMKKARLDLSGEELLFMEAVHWVTFYATNVPDVY